MKKLRTHILAAMAVGFIATPVMADDYYDDLYAPQRPVKKVARVRVQPGEHDYLPADAYSDKASNTLRMDVDRYNRRGNFLVGDPKTTDSLNVDDTFAFTRRIERYHNPEVVTESGDTTLVDYYYTSPGASNINVYLVDNTPGYYNWAWRYGNPWYWNVYGPAYTGWGGWGWYSPYYDPYWSYYGWNPYWNYGWGWGWDPYWDYGWGWGHGHGHWGGWYPAGNHKPTSSGAYRPHGGGSSTGIAGRNPGSTGRPGDRNQWTTNRPGNMGRPTYSGGSYNGGYNTAGTRPGTVTAQPGTRPSTSQGTYTPYGAGTRGRSGYGTAGSSSSTRNSYGTGNSYNRNGSSNSYNRNGNSNSYNRNGNSNTNSNRSSYNSSSSSSSGRSYNSGSSGSYQSRGGGSSGGSYSGGGGGGRGRR